MAQIVFQARSAAMAILAAYKRYREEFQSITKRAKQRFEERDWRNGQKDASERLDLYRLILKDIVEELNGILDTSIRDRACWKLMKGFYTEALAEVQSVEIAETFFNSVTRHIFVTVGVDANIEYVDLDIRRARYGAGSTIHRRYAVDEKLFAVVSRIFEDYAFGVPYKDALGDARAIAKEIESKWHNLGHEAPIDSIELIKPIFYRGSGAYLVGKIRGSAEVTPLIIALVNTDGWVQADAVLMDEREVSIVFSFTRSHFLVESKRPADIVGYLRTIMPRKPLAELYISLGNIKHGKTELYRDLLGHMNRSLDCFDHAPGDTGMVMIVFTMRSHDYVFKVIRDEFAYPKTSTRDVVMNRYQLVFKHDRAGRLIEAQEFEHLSFDIRRFSPALLEELKSSAANCVTVGNKQVAIHHLYIERRVEPLNLFLRSAEDSEAEAVVLDFGQAIRDLARTNIFPGDMLLKNFGVTRHGRVTFYDYDELCLVTECNFREMPQARSNDEEMSAQPFFFVGPHDVFPQEFLQFMGLPKVQRELLTSRHGQVLTAAFWRELKRRHEAGEVLDVYPYPSANRLNG